MQECERVVSRTFPACVAFHKPSFIQQAKNASMNMALVYALLATASRYVPRPSAPLSVSEFLQVWVDLIDTG